VNSSLDRFIRFFRTYAERAEKIREADRKKDKGYWELVRALRPALEAIDREALGGEGGYWAPVVEAIEEENE
jgi:hypothetical protein